METKSKYFDGHSSLSQSEENECMLTHNTDGVTSELRGMNGEKFKRKLTEVNTKNFPTNSFCLLDTALVLTSDNFLLNFPPSISRSSIVRPSMLCVHIHSFSFD